MDLTAFKRFFAKRPRTRRPRTQRPSPERQEPSMGTTLQLVDHSATRAADPYAFEASHRRLAWMLRLATMMNVGLFSVVIIEASAISSLVPLQKVQMGLVRIEPRDDKMVEVNPVTLVRILPIAQETPGFDLMMEAFVRRYVRLLMEIDATSQTDRMRECNVDSDADWWKRFVQSNAKEIDKAVQTSLNRSVIVESADMVSRRDGVSRYAVDIVQVDRQDGKEVSRKKLRAYVAVTSRPQLVREADKFENPLGLLVLDVTLKERNNS